MVLVIVVFGASGDLARRKIFPTLMELHSWNLLPNPLLIIGYCRTLHTTESFRNYLRRVLLAQNSDSSEVVDAFVSICTCCTGPYHSQEHIELMATQYTGFQDCNILFYFAVPCEVIIATAKLVRSFALSTCGWNRFVFEKPFGRDMETSMAMCLEIESLFSEDQIYRIDHYLAKEMVQSMLMFRFGNTFLEPILNRKHVHSVRITFKEQVDCCGRSGYFEKFGIIRDVIQSHLLQILATVAMDCPVKIFGEGSSSFIRDAKVKVLQSITPVRVADVLLGQYQGYREEAGVSSDSLTPTFAMMVLHVNSPKWAGVPFVVKAGKCLEQRRVEVRVRFVAAPAQDFLFDLPAAHEGSRYPGQGQVQGQLYEGTNHSPTTPSSSSSASAAMSRADCLAHAAASPLAGLDRACSPFALPQNELVCRMHPEEAIYLKVNTKTPGMTSLPCTSYLDLAPFPRSGDLYYPDSYGRLLLDVVRGNQSLFVRADELHAAWNILTPLLHALDSNPSAVPMHMYERESRGPVASDEMLAGLGIQFQS